MPFFQQIHRQVVCIVDLPVTKRLSEESAALREQVESPLRHVHLKSWNLLRQLHDKVASALEGLTHLLHALLRAIISRLCSLLRYRARTTGVLPLQLVHSLHDPLSSSHETYAPTRHRIRLRHTVDDHHPVAYLLKLRDALMLAHIVDVLVDLVSYHIHLRMLCQHSSQPCQFLLAIDRTRWVRWRAENQRLRLWRDGSLQLSRRDLEVLLYACMHYHRRTLSQLHHLRIAHPVRGWHDDLVARIDQCQHRVADTLLGTVATRDLSRCEIQPILLLQLPDNGVTQVGITRYGRVTRVILIDGFLGSLLDMIRRIEVGFPHTEVDHIHTLCLQLCTLLRHRQCGRWREAVQTIG